MSHLLFIDESGYDLHDSPYAVLAGVSIEDRDLWNLIGRIHDAEVVFFGRRVSDGLLEFKAKKLLKTKTYRLAGLLTPIPVAERTSAARRCLEKGIENRCVEGGGGASRLELVSLAQAKLAFVDQVLNLCAESRVKIFASIIPKEAQFPSSDDYLRKDYAYLFERFYYYLCDQRDDTMGLIVFDELERSLCHLLIDQMERYFRDTATGSARASQIIPEPFFVHSDLTTAIQLADIVAYIIAWGLRLPGMSAPRRPELDGIASKVADMRYSSIRESRSDAKQYRVWSCKVITDLRPRSERENEDVEAGI
jgi:hypothetical protein